MISVASWLVSQPIDFDHATPFQIRNVEGLTRVVAGLNGFVNDTVNDGQSIEVEGNSRVGAVPDLLVLLIEVIEKCRAVVLIPVRNDDKIQGEDVHTPP